MIIIEQHQTKSKIKLKKKLLIQMIDYYHSNFVTHGNKGLEPTTQ